MTRTFSFRLRGLAASLACSLALLATGVREADADIVLRIKVHNTEFDVAPAATLITANTYEVDTTALNGLLQLFQSGYTIGHLGVTSNFAGDTAGTLDLGGDIQYVGGANTYNDLTITAYEDGFSSPVGSNAVLSNSLTANFNRAGTANSQTATSGYNSTFLADVTQTSTGLGPDGKANGPNGSTVANFIPILVTTDTYRLTNVISFNMTTVGATDGFSVKSSFTAVVPEPASVLSLALGLAAPAMTGLWRRRRLRARGASA